MNLRGQIAKARLLVESRDEAKNQVGYSDLGLASTIEYGVHFVTGRPVSFRYVRNTGKAPQMGSRYQQDIEPSGLYLIHNPDPGDLSSGWQVGTVSFRRPLVIYFNMVEYGLYDAQSWKARLHAHYAKRGKALNAALRAAGYDGIVTVEAHGHGTREIVALDPHESVRTDTAEAFEPKPPRTIGETILRNTRPRQLLETRIRPSGRNTIGMEIEMSKSGVVHSGSDEDDMGAVEWPEAVHGLLKAVERVEDMVHLGIVLTNTGSTTAVRNSTIRIIESASRFLSWDRPYLVFVHEQNLVEPFQAMLKELTEISELTTAFFDTGRISPKDADRLTGVANSLRSCIHRHPALLGLDRDSVTPSNKRRQQAEEEFREAFEHIGWTVHEDPSIQPYGLEAVSPVIPITQIGELHKGLAVAKDLHEKGWKFNESTGLHVHVGTEHPPDLFYVLSLIQSAAEGEPDIYSQFPLRRENRYAKSMKPVWTRVMGFLWAKLEHVRRHQANYERAYGQHAPEHEELGEGERSIELSPADIDHIFSNVIPGPPVRAQLGEQPWRYYGVNAVPALAKHGTIEFRYFHGDPFLKSPALLDRLVRVLRKIMHNAQTRNYINAPGGKNHPKLVIERAGSTGLRVYEPKFAVAKTVQAKRSKPVVGDLTTQEIGDILRKKLLLQPEPPKPEKTTFGPDRPARGEIGRAYVAGLIYKQRKTQKERKQNPPGPTSQYGKTLA